MLLHIYDDDCTRRIDDSSLSSLGKDVRREGSHWNIIASARVSLKGAISRLKVQVQAASAHDSQAIDQLSFPEKKYLNRYT